MQPPSAAQYQAQFARALELTRQLGSPTGSGWAIPHPRRLAKEGGDARLQRVFTRCLGSIPNSRYAFQGLELSRRLLVAIADEYQCAAHYTVGSVSVCGQPLFRFNAEDLAKLLAVGREAAPTQVNMHAWITMDSYEIVDPTVLSTLATVQADPYAQMKGALLFGLPEELIDFRYQPVFVGVNLLKKAGLAL